ncbi:hypothetical protein [Jannaschia sp. CCS1]|uniref:hypothetical protein n=1 Tax=Jannaschia sp. (strain CCS1) TaxID=290400 RepID=UPI000053B0FE|nr:hypothetical protein [Jannaschia sp. CCS1]ABD55893.1 hypothetical protein Jann_2976 [Jannaschia sp. CCS1]
MTHHDDTATAARSAQDVFQAFLDHTSKLVLTNDAKGYCNHIVLPFVFRTGAGEVVIETEDDLLIDTIEICDWMKSHGITDYHRICRSAQYLPNGDIDGVHITYALNNAVAVMPPYANRSILRCVDGTWKVVLSEHEIANPLMPGKDTSAAPGVFSDDWPGAGDDFDGDPATALSVYQATISRMDDMCNARDFAGWIDCFVMPHAIHYDHTDHWVETPEEARAFFDMLVGSMETAQADVIVRTANFAAFVSKTRLLGYHDTSMTKNEALCFGPVKSRMILEHSDGVWRCANVTNSLANDRFAEGAFAPTTRLPTLRQINKRMQE